MGLIPAAGRGSRLGDLPFSKELLPLSDSVPTSKPAPCRVAIDNALETMASAGISETCIVIAPDKLDIPAHTGDGKRYGQRISYVIVEDSRNVPSSLDSAFFIARGREVALLFPDIVFEPRAALQEIKEQRRRDDADMTLALVPATSGEKIDIVTVLDSARVKRVVPKPGRDYTGWTWVAAIWNAEFTDFLHEILQSDLSEPAVEPDRELYVADIINAALSDGLNITSRAFLDGNSIDLGTPEDLAKFWSSGLG
jgi:glucose-1-phosphate thymidylyltransferase